MNYNIIMFVLFVVFILSSLFLGFVSRTVSQTYISFIESNEVLTKWKFDNYLKDFNKHYEGDEYEERFENFKASLKEIAKLNKLEGRTVFGLTKFSDMSKQEFAERMLLPTDLKTCRNKYLHCRNKNGQGPFNIDSVSYYGDRYQNVDPPENFDWRQTPGVIKEVLDQKRCLGCWAFSIVGVIESMSVIRKLDHERRSIQELLDCSPHNNGCSGGRVSTAMKFICHSDMPFVTDEQYPLTLAVDKVCKLSANATGRRVLEYAYQCNLNETLMIKQVATQGPLVVAVDATNWMNYIGGVIQRACRAGIGNHVVQLIGYVGYKTHNDSVIPHYILKNSYGEDFGENGYVKIGMNDNICGIRDQVTQLDVYN